MINATLTAKQVSEILGYSPAWVRMLALAGEIKYYRPAGRRKMTFLKADVAKFLGCKEEEL